MTNKLRALNNLKRELKGEEAQMKSLAWMLNKVEQAIKQDTEEELDEYYKWYEEYYDREECKSDI